MLCSVLTMADGHFSAIKRLYLDSRILQSELTRLDVERKASHEQHLPSEFARVMSTDGAEAAVLAPMLQTRGIFPSSCFLWTTRCQVRVSLTARPCAAVF
jgi:hypothetical protein